MPPGLTADLRGVAYCPEAGILAAANTSGRAEQAAPSCPASSLIGTSNVGAGPGSHPFHAIGKIYLAGPFKGAPLSLAVITPALAGPYDYGTVVVRVAINIDPRDAHVVADSETVPAIIGGVPIRMREIRVDIDRDKFMINPTNCSPKSVASQGIGDQGTVADFSSYFHANNCATLPFKPKMTVALKGARKQTKRGANPALHFDLNTRANDANIKSLSVTLPSAFEIDQRHLAQPLLREGTGRHPVRRPPGDRQGDDDDPAARTAALRARLRGLGLRRPAATRLHPQRSGQGRAPRRNDDDQGRAPADDRAGRFPTSRSATSR